MDTVLFGATEASVAKANGIVQVQFVREGSLTGSLVATYKTGDGTAQAGQNYVADTGSVTFGPGEASKLVSIAILDDNRISPNKNFSLELLNVTGGTIGIPRTTQVVILGNQGPPDVKPPDPTSIYDLTGAAVVSGLFAPTAFDWVPGQPATMLIAEKSGVIKVATNGVVRDTPLLDLSSSVNDAQDRGLLDIKLHPDFPNQPYLYAYYTVDPAGTAANPVGSPEGPDGTGNRYEHLVRYTVDTVAGQLQVRPNSAVVLLGGAGRSLQDISGGGRIISNEDLDQAPSGIRPDGTNVDNYIAVDSLSHSGGGLKFGPDGALYVSVGDGTSFNFADARALRAQDVNNLSGKVLRIDPLIGDGLADNPFFVPGAPDANASKVYQLGVRNAFRMAFDATGKLFLGDVGWYSWEEINTGTPGANFGWPFYEGGQKGINLPTPQYRDLPQAPAFYASGAPITAPLQAFSPIDTNSGFPIQALVLGDVYTGTGYPAALKNDLFFASLTTGQVFAINPGDPTGTVIPFPAQNATIVEMAQGPDGALYYADIAGGVIGKWAISTIGAPPPVVPPVTLPPVVPPTPVAPNFAVSNQTTGALSVVAGNASTGSVGGLAHELILITPDNLAVASRIPNVFIHTGSGTDAIDVWAGGGDNVLDGGGGSNYLVGGAGKDTFFVDARGAESAIWSTVRNLGSGDAATLWGVTPDTFALNWRDGQGAPGATGLTLHATRAGGPTASLTLSGYATNDLQNGRLALNFGENAGGKYLYVAAT